MEVHNGRVSTSKSTVENSMLIGSDPYNYGLLYLNKLTHLLLY